MNWKEILRNNIILFSGLTLLTLTFMSYSPSPSGFTYYTGLTPNILIAQLGLVLIIIGSFLFKWVKRK